MKIAVVGSRKFVDKEFVKKTVGKYFDIEYTLISGGAKGVDSWAEETIDEMNKIINPIYLIKKSIHKADWNNLSHSDAVIKTRPDGTKYDAKAGMRRNRLIINEADIVVVLWDGISSGTKNSIDLAIKAGKPVDIYIRK